MKQTSFCGIHVALIIYSSWRWCPANYMYMYFSFDYQVLTFITVTKKGDCAWNANKLKTCIVTKQRSRTVGVCMHSNSTLLQLVCRSTVLIVQPLPV